MRILALLLVLFTCSQQSFAADNLVILSPHRKTIQREFVPAFKQHYKNTYGTDVNVEWLDQGGTSNAVRYVRGKYLSNKDAIGIDLFWGGTSANFVDLADEGCLILTNSKVKHAKHYLRFVPGFR